VQLTGDGIVGVVVDVLLFSGINFLKEIWTFEYPGTQP
jgi:hypothetical protein